MKRFFTYNFIVLCLLLGLTPSVFAATKNPGQVPILMFHYIRDYHNPRDPVGNNLSISPKEFVKILEQIKKLGYNTITFKDIQSGTMPAKPIILTFDDGYEDFYSAAFGELQKRQMKAVAYIIVGAIGTPHYMNLEQIKTIAAYGIEIGGHTWTHPNLPTLSAAKQHIEIFNSKKYLETALGQKIISFAYPSGKYNNLSINEVKHSGYLFAVTTHPGLAHFNYDYTLYRLRISPGVDVAKLLINTKTVLK